MNIKELTYLLQNPDQLKKNQVTALERLTREFPYFQSIKALTLKGLKDQESFKYNQELKNTAAYTADRSVLFNFITSDLFTKKETDSPVIKTKAEIEVVDPHEIKALPRISMDDAVTMKMDEAEDVLDPELFTTRQEESVFTHVTISEALAKQSQETKEEAENNNDTPKNLDSSEENPLSILQVDKPLEFDKKETHSFSEWLKLTSLHPIDQGTDAPITTSEIEKEKTETSSEEEKSFLQKDKFDLIDQFIANSPKIPRASKPASSGNLAKRNQAAEEELMTETLARVYVAQKNYKKAIQAYKILILKNPEKSGFFADQIRAIKKLKENK